MGIHKTLVRVSSASATQTLACAAATTSGRASESRSAAARLIGNRRSVASNGAGFSLGVTNRGLKGLPASEGGGKADGRSSSGGGKADGRSPTSGTWVAEAVDAVKAGEPRSAPLGVGLPIGGVGEGSARDWPTLGAGCSPNNSPAMRDIAPLMNRTAMFRSAPS